MTKRQKLEAAWEAADDASRAAWDRLEAFWLAEFKAHCKRKKLCPRCGEDRTKGVKRTWSMRPRGGPIGDLTRDGRRNRRVRAQRKRARQLVKTANFTVCRTCKKARAGRGWHPGQEDLIAAYRESRGDTLATRFHGELDWPED